MTNIFQKQLRSLVAFTLVALLLARCASGNRGAAVDLATTSCPEMQSIPIYTKGGQVVAPKALRRVEPRVPDVLRENGRVVSAIVQAVVEPTGKVSSVCVVSSGDPVWAAAVAEALSSWVFSPGTVNGTPAPVRFQLTTTFRPQG